MKKLIPSQEQLTPGIPILPLPDKLTLRMTFPLPILSTSLFQWVINMILTVSRTSLKNFQRAVTSVKRDSEILERNLHRKEAEYNRKGSLFKVREPGKFSPIAQRL